MVNIAHCDICGKTTSVKKRFFLTDRVADAAGGMEDVGEQYDICDHCEVNALLVFMRESKAKDRYEPGRKMVDIIERLKDEEEFIEGL